MKRVSLFWFLAAVITTSSSHAFSPWWLTLHHRATPSRTHRRIAPSSSTRILSSSTTASSLPTNPLSQPATALNSVVTLDNGDCGCTTCKTCGSIYRIDHKLFGVQRGLVVGCSVCNQKWLQFKDKLFTPFASHHLVPMTPEEVAQVQGRFQERQQSAVETTTTTTPDSTATTTTTSDNAAAATTTTTTTTTTSSTINNNNNEDKTVVTTLSNVVCIHNLPKTMKRPEVMQLFSTTGTVVKVAFKMSSKRKQHLQEDPTFGMAFVTMGSANEAQNAIETLNGKEVDGGIVLSMELSKYYQHHRKPSKKKPPPPPPPQPEYPSQA